MGTQRRTRWFSHIEQQHNAQSHWFRQMPAMRTIHESRFPFETSNKEYSPHTGIIVFIAIILTAVITSGACMIASNNDANANTDDTSMSAAIISRFKAFSIPDDDPRRYTYLTDTRTRLFQFIGDIFDDYESIPASVWFDIQCTD